MARFEVRAKEVKYFTAIIEATDEHAAWGRAEELPPWDLAWEETLADWSVTGAKLETDDD